MMGIFDCGTTDHEANQYPKFQRDLDFVVQTNSEDIVCTSIVFFTSHGFNNF